MTSTPKFDIAEFEAAAARVRELNEQLIATYKKNQNVSLDAYEKTLATLLDFTEKTADATQVEWLSALVTTHAKFVTEISSAYTRAARDMIKG
ncbi:MAG: hypothetical protein CSB46_00395 [Micrococcales bacterium]|nr:MAG: hypothetical protein CSB46_00395 [Micrococcales bacterium]